MIIFIYTKGKRNAKYLLKYGISLRASPEASKEKKYILMKIE